MTNNRSRGFTLVELSLVMAFLSMLLLAILFTTLHIGKIYTKGVTNRQINQVGREVTDSIRRDFLAASADKIATMIPVDSGGRICLGTVSYVWNTIDLLHGSGTKIVDGSGDIIFSRVEDASGALCQKADDGGYPVQLEGMKKTNLLDSSGRSLAIYKIQFLPLKSSGNSGIYELRLTIGTNDPTVTQASSDTYQCKPPSDNSSDFNYCSVADFNIIVRAGGDAK